MAITLRLLRHGASANYDILESDEDQDVVRQTSSTPLGQKGIFQAHRLGNALAKIQTDVTFTSPYTRARETAEIAAKHVAIFPNVDSQLGEIRRVVDGRSISDPMVIEYKRWRNMVFKTHDLESKFHPSDESHGEFLRRVVDWERQLVREYDHQSILVFGHSQFFAMALTTMIHGPSVHPSHVFGTFNKYFMDHCGITTVEWHPRKGWKIINFNDTSHLK